MKFQKSRLWYWHKDSHRGLWNRMWGTDVDPHMYAQLILDRGTKVIWWRKDGLFNKYC